MQEYRQKFSLAVSPVQSDRFEILAITAGAANGWEFTAEVLHESLPLWEGVKCFVDHALSERSLRDMAGVLSSVSWDQLNQGVRAELKAVGPSSDVLKTLAAQVLSGSEDAAQPGFSADILFKGHSGRVEKILKILSVDLVHSPARGGVFVRALNQTGFGLSKNGGSKMSDWTELDGSTQPTAEAPASPTAPQGVHGSLAEAETPLPAQLAELRAMRQEMSQWLLETTLSNSILPASLQKRLRTEFGGRTFAPAELQTAVREARLLLSELEGGRAVYGPARVEGMIEPADRLQAAADDLFGVPRDSAVRNASVPRLSGIRELYLALTGDYDLHGGYHPQRAQLATTVDFSALVKNSLNKLVANTWEELGRAGYDWWKAVSVQEHFNSLHDITGTLIGTVGDLPEVDEGGDYPELLVGDSGEVASFVKYGGYIPLTLELIDRDETRKLRSYACELASAGMRKISSLVARIFSANAGVGPDMSDGSALFNIEQVTIIGGHHNLGTAALSPAAWDEASAQVYQQPMLTQNNGSEHGKGPMMAVNPKFLLVPRPLQRTAMELCGGSFVREANYVYDNVLKGSAVPLVVPEWTDAKDWAAACEPRVAPAIFVGERFGLAPEIFIAGDELSPAVFSSDEHRLKVRHWLAVWVNDFRPLFKSNVA
jgi:hypothetical protein